MHLSDFWNDLRRTVLPPVGRLVAEANDALGTDYYVTATTDHEEFVGVVGMSRDELEFHLHDMGAVRNPAAAWKRLRGTDKHEQGSYAFRGEWRETAWHHNPIGDYQLHVIVYELDDIAETTAVFAHYEYSWVTHPIKHYRAEHVDGNGVQMLRTMLKRNGVDFYATDYSGI